MGPGVGFDVAARAEGLEGAQSRSRLERARLQARLNHMQRCPAARVPMPRHQPLPLHAWCPVLLRTGAAGKRRAAEWALRGSWVGKKLGAPAKCGRGCKASWGTGNHWPPEYASPPPNLPCAPRPRILLHPSSRRAVGRGQCGQLALLHMLHSPSHACAFEQTIAHFHSHRLLTHCRHVQLQACASRPSFLLHPKRCWLASPRSSSQQGYAVCNTQCYTRCVV